MRAEKTLHQGLCFSYGVRFGLFLSNNVEETALPICFVTQSDVCPVWCGTACPQIQAIPQGFGSEAPLIEEEAADITDEAAYSIQEDKLKTEDDNR